MVEAQLRGRDIVDERVLRAMAAVPASNSSASASGAAPTRTPALPISGGQTISQPYMVARICEALQLTGSERVLDVGTGSGYQAAVLAELAAEVHTIERIPELAEAARERLARGGLRSRPASMSATERWACPSSRPSTESPSPPRRPVSRRRSMSS